MTRLTLVSAHARVQHNLPWYVAGTLDDDSIAEVREHLAECEACRHECARELRIATMMRRDAVVDIAPQAPLARLMERIEVREQRQLWFVRLKSWFTAPERRVLIGAVGIQAIAIVALAGVLLAMTYQSRKIAAYETLSRDSRPPATDGLLLRVVFAEELPTGELLKILAATGARIVGGPGANGILTLALTPAVDDRDAEIVAARLRDHPGVRFAEVVTANGP